MKMAESLDCDISEKLDTDKTISITNDKTLDLETKSTLSLSLEGSVVASPSIESFSTLPEGESSLNLCEESSDLAVRVDNPQKHFDLLDTYITFRVTTKTTRPELKSCDHCVRRRYNDFIWLRQHLIEEYPTHFIPPLPVKHSILGQLDRYGRQFVTARMAALQTFLSRVARHPVLSSAACFQCFLTASIKDFQDLRKFTASSILSKVSDSINSLSTMHIEPNRPLELKKLSDYLMILSDKLAHIIKISQRIHKENTEQLNELSELKSTFQSWAGTESDLTDPLCEVASAIDKTKQSLQSILLETENFILTQPIKEYLLYVEAVKEALGRRDNIEINYRYLLEGLDKKRQEHEELQVVDNGYTNILSSWTKAPLESKEERVKRLEIEIPQCEQQVQEAHNKLECADENIRSDLERWNIGKKVDLKNILISFADQHISHYEQCLRAWNEVLVQTPGDVRGRDRKAESNSTTAT